MVATRAHLPHNKIGARPNVAMAAKLPRDGHHYEPEKVEQDSFKFDFESMPFADSMTRKQKDKIIHAAESKQYKAVERLAKQSGASAKDANSLVAMAEVDAFEMASKRHARHAYHKLEENTDTWLSLSEMTDAKFTDVAKNSFLRNAKKNFGA